MPAITNWGTVKSAVTTLIRRDDLVAEYPVYLQFASQRLLTDLTANWLEKAFSFSTVQGVAETTLPTDFLGVRKVAWQRGVIDVNLEHQEINQTIGNTGSPRAYSIARDRLVLTPTPDGIYPIVVTYKFRPPELIADGDTNVFVTRATEALVKAICAEIAKSTLDAERAVMWEQDYGRAVMKLNQDEWEVTTTISVKSSVRSV